MINVKKTLQSTIREKIDRLRMLADNNSLAFKKIIYLIIMDDLYDWADYRDDKLSIQRYLLKLRYDFIRQNSEFNIERNNNPMRSYMNVNTPQTNNTWKRVWDAPDLISINSYIEPEIPELPTSFTPDNSCNVEIVYFPNVSLHMEEDINGYPVVDLNTLSTCQKMNVYVNRNNGQMFYLDENCSWLKINNEYTGDLSASQIKDLVVYKGIKHEILDPENPNKVLRVELLKEGDFTSDVQLTNDDEDLEGF